jgi:hypothetical protein
MLHWRKRVPAPDLRSIRRHPSLIEPLPPTADGAFDQALRVEFSWRAERLPPKCDDSDADNDGDDWEQEVGSQRHGRFVHVSNQRSGDR